MAPGPQERLLGDVLGGAGLAHDRERQPEHPPLEAAHECRGRFGIAGCQAGEQGVVGDGPHRALRLSAGFGLAHPREG